MVGLALLVEALISGQEYSTWALPTSLGSGFCAAIVALLVLTRMRKQAYVGTPMSLALAAAVLFSSSAVLSFIVAARLPDEPLVRASDGQCRRTSGGSRAWAKHYSFLCWPSSHCKRSSCSLYEVRMGRTDEIRNLFSTAEEQSLPRARTTCRRSSHRHLLLVAGPWILANSNLFTSLEDGQYDGLFFALDFARVASGLLTLLWVFLWYVSSVRHLKRVTALRR